MRPSGTSTRRKFLWNLAEPYKAGQSYAELRRATPKQDALKFSMGSWSNFWRARHVFDRGVSCS